jgi:hypothetical protein
MLASWAAPNLAKPNPADMREFRLSRLTDEHLRELHAKAKVVVETRRAANEKVIKEAEAAVYASIAECNAKIDDPAYRARHHPTGCPSPPSHVWDIYSRPMREQTIVEIFEDMIMGECNVVSTVWEARYAGCLP